MATAAPLVTTTAQPVATADAYRTLTTGYAGKTQTKEISSLLRIFQWANYDSLTPSSSTLLLLAVLFAISLGFRY